MMSTDGMMKEFLILKVVVTQRLLDLDINKEPGIFKAIRRDALLENVTVNSDGFG